MLIKVLNEAAVTTPLLVRSPNASALAESPAAEVNSRWLGITQFDAPPMLPEMSGLALEYRIVQL